MHQSYFDAIDIQALRQEFPIGPAFLERYQNLSRDALRQHQEGQFARQLKRAWQLPFYQRLWAQAGVQPHHILSLDDLPRLPVFGKH